LMEELSLHILDLVQNSVRAGAKNIYIIIEEDSKKDILSIEVIDDGKGMDKETIEKVQSPFFSSKLDKRVGLGIPLLKQSAIHCDGEFKIESVPGEGTRVKAIFRSSHIDLPPMGDLENTFFTIITTIPDVNFCIRYKKDSKIFSLDTSEIKKLLGDIPLTHPEVLGFLKKYIHENFKKMMEVRYEA